ncbi:MAG: peptide deformylase [Candidatus Omnitrophica bacterium]|nr:peptide deformylase [Candidatus Omnitrophota bacterium]
MTVRRIVEYPNPLLRHETIPVAKIDSRIRQLITDLIDTLHAFPGCVGIAANQIGERDRIAIVDVSEKEKDKNALILINPQIVSFIGEKFLREGCLSVQNLTANVKRSDEVVVEWMDESGKERVHHAHGIEAVCIQHEVDHLNGGLFIDRVLNAQTDIFRRKKYLH